MTRRLWIGWSLVGLAIVALPGVAWPHAFLVKAIPAHRATLFHSPNRVQLWFNERLEPAYSTVSVVDRENQRVDSQDARVGPDDSKLLSVTIPMLTPGTYTIRFRVLSVDGHVVESAYPFTIRSDRAKP
ncbi:MAG: copper resistance CopC family protein [candidate division NC10 bacterium]